MALLTLSVELLLVFVLVSLAVPVVDCRAFAVETTPAARFYMPAKISLFSFRTGNPSGFRSL